MIKLLSYIFSFFKKKYPTGLLPDPRPAEEVKKDYTHEEVKTAGVTIWGTQPPQVPFPKEDQKATSSCVGHGVSGAYGSETKNDAGGYIRLSKMFIYRKRANFPAEGMWLQNAFDILQQSGSCLYDTLPNVPTEAQANAITITQAMIDEAAGFKGKEYYSITEPNNIETLAQLASQGYAIPILIYASYREWAQEYPQLWDNPAPMQAAVRHCIFVVPLGGWIKDGVRYITILDSSPFGGFHIRHLSEAFVKARVFGGVYWKSVVLEAGHGPRPRALTGRTLDVGAKGLDVLALQNCLIYEGVLPSDCSTGNFGGRTRAGVKAFQARYAAEILTPSGLEKPTGTYGPATRKKLQALYP